MAAPHPPRIKRTAWELTWKKAKEIWPHGPQTWPNISIGTILGVGCTSTVENRRAKWPQHVINGGQTMNKTTSLLKVLIAKAIHLIWVIRCDKAVNKGHMPQMAESDQLIQD